MNCAWDACIRLLPPRMRGEVDRFGKNRLQELRLRLGYPPELRYGETSFWLANPVKPEDISFVVNAASQYSPWNAATSASGFLTAPGGHRIGICGDIITQNGKITGVRTVSSLNIRISRDFPGIARDAAAFKGSILILGQPGSGKTTLLRDLIRQISEKGPGCVCVVDERCELFPKDNGISCFPAGRRTDILSGSGKASGILSVLRSMGPSCIAVDEITAKEDCDALLQSGWCGVRLLATAHGRDREDILKRPVYRPLAENRLFDRLLVMQPDKSWREERFTI